MKIIIATDGSKFSEAAVATACRIISDPQHTELMIVSAFESPVMVAAAPYAYPVQYNERLETGLREQAAQAVEQAARQIRLRRPEMEQRLTTRILHGAPEQAIIEEAENWAADLIVVGSHGYGFWERMFLGSVSNAIVRHAHCSVMVVRADIGEKENPG